MTPDHPSQKPLSEDALMRVQRERREAIVYTPEELMTDVELARWRADSEKKRFRKWLWVALRSLLLWIAGVTGALLSAWDVLIHLTSTGPHR